MDFHFIKNVLSNKTHKFINERRGWKTDRKIVIIESDDWGSIRMPSRSVYEKSLKKGLDVDKCAYCKYDTLASTDDLDALFNTLTKYKDHKGNHPIITANTIVANPDFERIKADKYENYHYEVFTDTLNKYENTNFDMWKHGISNKLFYPQLHGREHLNIERWLMCLQNKSTELHFAFDNSFFGVSQSISKESNPSFMAALDYDTGEGKEQGNRAIEDGIEIFSDCFGFNSKSFIAPNYFWHSETEKILSAGNVKYLQGGFVQKVPSANSKYHYLGEKNNYNQVYLTRNVIFEPASFVNKDWVSTALKQIKHAFKVNKPAIISTHRVAFIGSIFEENRSKNLKLLQLLLHEILKQWPDVEFMHSAELGDLIKAEQ
ncbi:hypothetical protein [Pseudoalteromonas sp. MelDa3]|uniref:hypothetical protein n=1 Tax=Pseudoalteromonas sp. MelDa3 TaxID=888435 RepID=UPI000CC49422|nr:hypothetical protein [Pseudoalteromonas sp. MelDa3]PLT23145.1 hypothetical protein CXF89_21025 [Pseudoalteromonas sp. MelDa3]